MFNRVNPWKIVLDHFSTLRQFNANSKRISLSDSIVFILIPLMLSAVLVFNGFSIRPYIGYLISCVAVFGGFLFNLLAIIYSVIDKISKDAIDEKNELKKLFAREIHINISYCILLSILLTITLILHTISIRPGTINVLAKNIVLTSTYFLLINFFLTLMMVLNRIYILLKKESE